MGISSTIFGCSGTTLTTEEKTFFTKTQPWGFILFARNIDSPEQVSALVEELKACVEHDEVPVLIDQEGGRVRRLRPPHWPDYPAGEVFGQLYEQKEEDGLRLAWLQSRLMAFDLLKLGINVDCLPVLDVPSEDGHNVIGDRAYSNDPDIVTEIGRAAARGLLEGGVLPIIKHIPGHGRASVDSHKALPVVDASLAELMITDFRPFKDLSMLPLAMTAHVVYRQIDPDEPATTSARVIGDIIRNYMKFDGLLMTDDLSMHALSGDFSERTQSSFAAGCDVVLHCHGHMHEMEPIAAAAPELSGDALRRATTATNLLASSRPVENELTESRLREEFLELCDTGDYESDPTEAGL